MVRGIFHSMTRGNFFYLLFSLLLLLLLIPFFEGSVVGNTVVDLAFSAVLLSAIYAVSERKQQFMIAIVLAIPMIVTRWANHFLKNDFLILAAEGFTILFLVFTVVLILSYVLRDEEVTANKIYGALSVYLLIGLIWALLFVMIEGMWPGSFLMGQAPGTPLLEKLRQFTYYSFVTLTTLGYGDVTPLAAPARTLAYLEAVVGQIYLAVLIARLVGLHIAHSMKKEPR